MILGFEGWKEGSWGPLGFGAGMNLNHWQDGVWASGSWVPESWGGSGEVSAEAFLLHGGGAGRKKDHSVREELKRLFADPGETAEEVKAIVWPHAEMIRGQVHIDWASLKNDLQAIDRLLRLMQEDDDISILLLQ